MPERTAALVLGLGNLLFADDGAGIAAIDELRKRYVLPAGVEVLDGGTLGLALLPHLQRAEHVIIVDAIAADAAPGTLLRLEGSEVGPAVAHRLSPHQVGVADLLDGLRLLGGGPERIVLWGVVPQRLELAFERSPVVQRSLVGLATVVAAELQQLGFAVRQRGTPIDAQCGLHNGMGDAARNVFSLP